MSKSYFIIQETCLEDKNSIVWENSYFSLEECQKAIERNLKITYNWKKTPTFLNFQDEFSFEIVEINLPLTEDNLPLTENPTMKLIDQMIEVEKEDIDIASKSIQRNSSSGNIISKAELISRANIKLELLRYLKNRLK